MAPLPKASFFAIFATVFSRIFPDLFRSINNALVRFQTSFKGVLEVNREHHDNLDTKHEIYTKKDHDLDQAVDVEETISQHDEIVTAIMDVIETFSLHQLGHGFLGRVVFSPRVRRNVSAGRKIPMVLPAFPAKSINCADKVLGPLPDLGEELALDRLNDLCRSIQRVYEPGAMVLIATDGPCYNGMPTSPFSNDYTEPLSRSYWSHGR